MQKIANVSDRGRNRNEENERRDDQASVPFFQKWQEKDANARSDLITKSCEHVAFSHAKQIFKMIKSNFHRQSQLKRQTIKE